MLKLESDIQVRADGLFRPCEDDLRAKLQRTLAQIDSDCIRRGLYNSSARLGDRHEANMACLRAILEQRVRSMLQTHEESGQQLRSESVDYITGELEKISNDWRERLTLEARTETNKSGLRALAEPAKQLDSAISRDVQTELDRSTLLLASEEARLKLIESPLPQSPEHRVARFLNRYGPENPRKWLWTILAGLILLACRKFLP